MCTDDDDARSALDAPWPRSKYRSAMNNFFRQTAGPGGSDGSRRRSFRNQPLITELQDAGGKVILSCSGIDFRSRLAEALSVRAGVLDIVKATDTVSTVIINYWHLVEVFTNVSSNDLLTAIRRNRRWLRLLSSNAW